MLVATPALEMLYRVVSLTLYRVPAKSVMPLFLPDNEQKVTVPGLVVNVASAAPVTSLIGIRFSVF
jgi:hypothetical protein